MTQLNLFDTESPVTPASSRQQHSGGQDSLLVLAELIRQGRDQIEAQARRRGQPIQQIGDLAQAVLYRHDLVAHRRAAAVNAAATSVGQVAGDVNVAS